MLMNSLDPEVAEGGDLAAGDRATYHTLAAALTTLGGEETLLVQSGQPVGVFPTHRAAPRVLLVDADLAGHGSCRDRSSWIDIGTQAVLQDAYEGFAAAARQHFGGSLAGKLVLAGGMGGAGGVQPLAATLNGAAFLGVEADAGRIKRRLRVGYCDIMVHDLDEALRILRIAVRKREAVSVGLVGNCAEVLPELARRGVLPDLLTEPTTRGSEPARSGEPLHGYIPAGLDPQAAAELRRRDPDGYRTRALDSIAVHVEAMRELQRAGAVVLAAGQLRPLLGRGYARLRWVALSGEASDIHAADARALQLFPADESLHRWLALAKKHVRFQGLPARVGWLGAAERSRLGLELNAMVRSGELKAPIVLGRDQSYQEPEAMAGALLASASGASWVAIQSAGGVAAGGALHLSQAMVADGTDALAGRLQRVLDNEAMSLDEAAWRRDAQSGRPLPPVEARPQSPSTGVPSAQRRGGSTGVPSAQRRGGSGSDPAKSGEPQSPARPGVQGEMP